MVWQVKCLIIETPQAGICIHITFLQNIDLCICCELWWGKSGPVMSPSSEKPTLLLSTLQLSHICKWQEVMLGWRLPLRNWGSLSVFYLSSQALPSSLISLLTCFISAARSHSESPVKFNHSLLVALPAAVGNQENTEVRRIPTRTEVCDYTDPGTHVRRGSWGCLNIRLLAKDARNQGIILIYFCEEGPLIAFIKNI